MKKNWDWQRFEKDFVSKATYKENGNFKTVLNPERPDLVNRSSPFGTILRKIFFKKKVKYFSIAFILILSLELALLILKIV
jgi:hypothetical protein